MEDRQEEYTSLLQVEDIRDYATKEALEISGRLIDLSLDLRQLSGITKALQFLDEIGTRKLSTIERTQLYYFRANAIANQSCVTDEPRSQIWSWERIYLEEQILNLRLALRASLDSAIPSELLCAVRTNLGNTLSHVGRFVEAIEHWNKALAVLPGFGMAQANRGVALCHYAETVHHPHDALPLLRRAVVDLEAGIRSGNMLEESLGYFRQYYSWAAENAAMLESHALSHRISYGASDPEAEYRKWCADNTLCLNYLNDIASDPASARDGLLLPPMVLPIGTGPRYHGLFNQLKQEFVVARFFLYEAIVSREVHFSDIGVDLYDTLDYPSYSIAVEKLKVAFRICYSLFDKIAFFLNAYLGLGIPGNKVSFRTCWYLGETRDKSLRTELTNLQNWPLRGLFWLSKDLAERKAGFKDALEPDAQDLAVMRNHLEHKYLKVHEFGTPQPIADVQDAVYHDNLAYSIGRQELQQKTLRLLKTTRAALIYLALSVTAQESISDGVTPRDKTVEIPITFFDDNWKF